MSRRKRIVLYVVIASVIAGGAWGAWRRHIESTLGYKVKELIAKRCRQGDPPTWFERFLSECGLRDEPQDYHYPEFVRDIRALDESAIPHLVEMLKHSDAEFRQNAAHALSLFGPAAKSAVPALVDSLSDEDPLVRVAAAGTLGYIGPAAKEAVPALIEALKDEEEGVREWAAAALGKIGPDAKEAVPALIEVLKDEDEDVREAAKWALDQIRSAQVPPR